MILTDESGDPLNALDKTSLDKIPHEKEIPYICPGIYCDCEQNNIFFDENDEAFSLFVINI